jgi:hypothetical protein
MIHAVLFVVVVGAVTIALAVDVAVVVAWMRQEGRTSSRFARTPERRRRRGDHAGAEFLERWIGRQERGR